MMKLILYYVHDPMCSWCWGFTQTLNALLENLPDDIEVKRILGGLASDSDLAMPDSMQQEIKRNWARIEDTIPGVKFNFDFWNNNIARRSTYPACCAVIAARKQGAKNDLLMTKAIQNAYYQQARNPSDESTLIELADSIDLIIPEFEKALHLKETQEELLSEIKFSRENYVESFPNLVLKKEGAIFSIPVDYNDSQKMLTKINNILLA